MARVRIHFAVERLRQCDRDRAIAGGERHVTGAGDGLHPHVDPAIAGADIDWPAGRRDVHAAVTGGSTHGPRRAVDLEVAVAGGNVDRPGRERDAYIAVPGANQDVVAGPVHRHRAVARYGIEPHAFGQRDGEAGGRRALIATPIPSTAAAIVTRTPAIVHGAQGDAVALLFDLERQLLAAAGAPVGPELDTVARAFANLDGAVEVPDTKRLARRDLAGPGKELVTRAVLASGQGREQRDCESGSAEHGHQSWDIRATFARSYWLEDPATQQQTKTQNPSANCGLGSCVCS